VGFLRRRNKKGNGKEMDETIDISFNRRIQRELTEEDGSVPGMSEIAIRKPMNGTGWDGTGLEMRLAGWDWLWKSGWNTVRERQKGTGDFIPNSHDWYFPFTLAHFRSYFINKSIPFNLAHAWSVQLISSASFVRKVNNTFYIKSG
jgi:hypothetical protein